MPRAKAHDPLTGLHPDRLTDEQSRLAAEHVGCMNLLQKPWIRRNPAHEEEIRTAAALALLDAARGFRPERGLKFSALLSRCVANQCNNAMKTARRMKRSAPTESLRFEPAADFEGDPDDGELLLILLDALPARASDFVRRHVVGGEKLKSIADGYGLTAPLVQVVVGRSLESLRSHPALEGLDEWPGGT